MVTAVDTNVLLDVFLDDPTYRRSSFDALTRAREAGSVVVSDVVWAETGAAFGDLATFEAAMRTLSLCADRLLTRDKGFYRDYFSDLEIVDPSSDV